MVEKEKRAVIPEGVDRRSDSDTIKACHPNAASSAEDSTSSAPAPAKNDAHFGKVRTCLSNCATMFLSRCVVLMD